MSGLVSRSGRVLSTAPVASEPAGGRSRSGPAWWVRPLLILTTAAFVDDGALAPRIVLHLRRRQEAGWLIRTTGPRNYVSWRNARALCGPVPILVLPNCEFHLTHDERNIAVIRDVFLAEFRARGHPLGRSGTTFWAFLTAIAGETGMEPRHLTRLLEAIEAKIQASLVA